MMTTPQFIGWLATTASVVSFVPQAWKIIRTRETEDISAAMYCLTVAGFGLWTAYGVLLGAWPLVATNAVCATLSAFILAMTVLPSDRTEKIASKLDPSD
tara:strand:- start:1520 stop:1819 length:300 start_codon:yes stop_codon:yes gene_type:complete